jgi:HEAT repeat protein
MEDPRPKSKPFSEIIDALLTINTPFSPTYLHEFSDLHPDSLVNLKQIWSKIDSQRRFSLLEDLENLAEADTHVCFDEVAFIALEDTDPDTRSVAIRLLWECKNQRLIPIFLSLMETDGSEKVRAAAAAALGLFVYLGELEELHSDTLIEIENCLLSMMQSTDTPMVRQRVLESLGYSSRDEIDELLLKAFESDDADWTCCSIYAMGRSADIKWERFILKMLDHPNVRIQFEAVRTAGQLELHGARKPLDELLEEPESLDDEVRIAAIMALSTIGGETASSTLEQLITQSSDADEIAAIQDAIDHLKFTNGDPSFDLLAFSPRSSNEIDDLDNILGTGEEIFDADLSDDDEGDEIGYFFGESD